ncbi:gas vesicle protein GvpH [Natronococcus wangiae]|uniref:gas vesicle protein GvpH n=1 Tax=Natronococcus wangiae TaxID=3068275 RepID=UPI00273E6E6E|nr:gas vesicle protein GvpH [Natronococcus sp. AD5]
MIEGNVSGVPPPSAEPIERADVDDGKAARRRETSDSKRKRKKRTRERPSEECLVDTHLIDDEFIVTADIPGARKGDVAAGLNPRTDELVISKNGAIVGRVTLP